MIYGNIQGIKENILNGLEKIYELKLNKNYIINEELIDIMCRVTEAIKREISVEIDKRGNVLNISIGDSSTVEMPIIDAREKKLSGVCILHTHPNGNSDLSMLDISALKNLKLDYIAAIGVKNGIYNEITFGFINVENNILNYSKYGPMNISQAHEFDISSKISESEKMIKNIEIEDDDTEKAILVGIDTKESLDELEELAEACGIKTLYKIMQNKEKIDNTYYVGAGKIEEIAYIIQSYNANLVIFDDELEGSQIRNIENALGVKIIDRTTLILEIFARRARSNEAKIQVELAQLKYRLSRLIGFGAQMSRTGAGIGTRGPGEKKLETDRRHIKDRIYELNKQLKKIRSNRNIQRNKRNKENIPQAALVGYTNAGKSTLRNNICKIYGENKCEVFAKDMLFATLDTTVRAVQLNDFRTITLLDTVGFISKLPHDLVEAFKSTLEEVVFSDLLIHVVDASSPNCLEQIHVVNEVLKELNAIDKPIIIVLNKIDKCSKDKIDIIKNSCNDFDTVEISAKNGTNIDKLIENILKFLPDTLKEGEFLIPYTEQSIVSSFHEIAEVISEEYTEDGTLIKVKLEEKYFNKYKKYSIIR